MHPFYILNALSIKSQVAKNYNAEEKGQYMALCPWKYINIYIYIHDNLQNQTPLSKSEPDKKEKRLRTRPEKTK